MKKVAFRVLYREFLFRLVDREVLSGSAQGDANKLLGRCAAILILLSMPFTFAAMAIGDLRLPHGAALVSAWGTEHSLIATTMLIAGLFTVLSWDSAYPDRRDIFVLLPLPVRAETIFRAKIASLAAALSLAVVVFNAAPGLLLPCALVPHDASIVGVLLSGDFYQPLAAYWITMFAAAAFVLCSVLSVQGIAAQLPRHLFLRVSAVLQLAVFCLFVCGYFLQPSLASPEALTNPENKRLLVWLPSYWFLGIFQELNGSLNGASHIVLTALADRAWIGLAVVMITTSLTFLWSYFRTMWKIVEEPDIVPGFGGRIWLPCFGNSIETAVTHFSIRSLIRSRRHRVLLSFYAGIGFAIVILFLKTPVARMLSAASSGGPWPPEVTLSMLASSFVMMCFWMVGVRAVFGVPFELRANWIFRITQIRADEQYFAAIRRALYTVAAAPIWAASAVLFCSLWSLRPAVEHVAVLVLLGIIIAELCLGSLHKVPFTCSYLPGKSHLQVTFVMCLLMGLDAVYWSSQFERRALADLTRYAWMMGALCVIAFLARWRTARSSLDEILRFEEEMPPAITILGLHGDK